MDGGQMVLILFSILRDFVGWMKKGNFKCLKCYNENSFLLLFLPVFIFTPSRTFLKLLHIPGKL